MKQNASIPKGTTYTVPADAVEGKDGVKIEGEDKNDGVAGDEVEEDDVAEDEVEDENV